jgi:hypothetical protein
MPARRPPPRWRMLSRPAKKRRSCWIYPFPEFSSLAFKERIAFTRRPRYAAVHRMAGFVFRLLAVGRENRFARHYSLIPPRVQPSGTSWTLAIKPTGRRSPGPRLSTLRALLGLAEVSTISHLCGFGIGASDRVARGWLAV